MAAVKMQIVYRDLADYGLPLVTPDQPEFVDLVADILSRPRRFGNCPPEEIPTAAVLLNRDPALISERGQAVRWLLRLFERTEAMRTLASGSSFILTSCMRAC